MSDAWNARDVYAFIIACEGGFVPSEPGIFSGPAASRRFNEAQFACHAHAWLNKNYVRDHNFFELPPPQCPPPMPPEPAALVELLLHSWNPFPLEQEERDELPAARAAALQRAGELFALTMAGWRAQAAWCDANAKPSAPAEHAPAEEPQAQEEDQPEPEPEPKTPPTAPAAAPAQKNGGLLLLALFWLSRRRGRA